VKKTSAFILSLFALCFSILAHAADSYTPPQVIHCEMKSPGAELVCSGKNFDARYLMVTGFFIKSEESPVDLQLLSASVRPEYGNKIYYHYEVTNNGPRPAEEYVDLENTYHWIQPDLNHSDWVKGKFQPYECKGNCPMTNLPFIDNKAGKQ
jgi:hypothetical protein